MINVQSILKYSCLLLLTVQLNAQQKKPNILILYADDMGYADLGVNYAESKIPTPNLDKLVSEGMNFSDGHSSSAVCSPSRFGLLTGQYHWRQFHDISRAFSECVIKDETLTLPEMLKAKGYNTAAIGKWHLGMGWTKMLKQPKLRVKSAYGKGKAPEAFDWSKKLDNGPFFHGFDYFFGNTAINFPPYAWIENDRVLGVPDRMWEGEGIPGPKEGEWNGSRPGPALKGWNPYENVPTTTQKAIDYINKEAKNEEPFFLYFAFPSPHGPLIPNDEFDGSSKAGAYGDYVVETDDACGKILKALEESGQAENTIVVFSADNGCESNAYKLDEKYNHWPSAPFRGVKRDIYEGGHHVPFVVKWPGVIEPGSKSEAIISQIDLMGTFAGILGYDLPDDQAVDSYNQLAVWKGEKDAVRESIVNNTREDQWAMRVGEWKLVNIDNVSTKTRERAKQKWYDKHGYPRSEKWIDELYNFKDDIGERYDIAKEHPDKVKELKALLYKIKKQGYSSPRIGQ